MGRPEPISATSELAKTLATTLRRSIGELVELSKSPYKEPEEVKGNIDIDRLAQNAKTKDQISDLSNIGDTYVCWDKFIIDNGDGKIGKGDLFLDGFAQCPYNPKANSGVSFSYIRIFGSAEMTCQPFYGEGKISKTTKISPEVEKILTKLKALEGKTYKEVAPQLYEVCTKAK